MLRIHLIFLYAYVILICKAMTACYRIIDFNYIHVHFLFIIGVLLYKLYDFAASKIIIKRSGILLAVSTLLVILLFNFDTFKLIWNSYMLQNFNSINLSIYHGTETSFSQFLPFLIVLIPLTVAFCCYFFSKGLSYISIIIIILFMFSFWNNGLDRRLAYYVPFYIALSLAHFGVVKYDAIVRRYECSNIKVIVTFKNILFYSLIVSTAITLLSVSASHLFGTKSIVQLKSDYDTKKAALFNNSNESAFNLSNTGYSTDSQKLGGPVELNAYVSLKVKADRPLYLRGTVKDHYSGNNWSKSTDQFNVIGKDINMPLEGETKRITVYNYGISTSTLFAPINTVRITPKKGSVISDATYMFMLLGDPDRNESYAIKYYDNSTFGNISYVTDFENFLDIKQYQDNIVDKYNNYLQIPESITPRIYDLVSEITENCTTTEDKIDSIMNYLSRNYPYSLKVSEVPEAEDFVDYFLFTEKKGYCTYFATAAAMMFRIAGIPARYVEGFNMDEEKNPEGLYIVRNHRAHAWVEILQSPENDLWIIADCVPQGVSIDEITDSNIYRDRFDDDRYKTEDYLFTDPALKEKSTYRIKNFVELYPNLIYALFIIPSAAVLLLLLFILYRLIRFANAVSRLLKNESMIPYYKHLSLRFELIGEGFPVQCCELEYVRSLKEKATSECLEKVVTACYDEHYGGKNISLEIDKKACNRIIERYIRKKQGFIRYLYYIVRYS